MVSLVRSTSVCWISFVPVFFCVILSFIIVLSTPTLVIFHANQAFMCLGPIRIKGEVRTTKYVYDLQYCFIDSSKVVSFVDHFCYLFHVCLYNNV